MENIMARILNANIDITLGGENASNEVISSQRAIKTYVDNKFGNSGYHTTCPAITPVSGVATWVVTHNLGSSDIICTLYNDSGAEIVKNTTINSANQITVTFNTISNVSAGDYTIVVLATGGSSGGGSGAGLPDQTGQSGKFLTTNGTSASWATVNNITVDSTLSTSSTNPVQNNTITNALGDLSTLETTTKTNLVSAINEVKQLANVGISVVSDTNGLLILEPVKETYYTSLLSEV